MKFIAHKKFTKKLRSLPVKIQKRTQQRLVLFAKNPHDPMLRNHELRGKYNGYRSINVTGDYRIVFKELADGSVILLLVIGTHSELYG